MDRLPVIDMRGFADGAFERITAEIAQACRGIGFFYVVNHGVAPVLMRAAFAEARAFFAEPVAAKAALAIEHVGGNRGYSGLKHEALDPKVGADLKEAFNIGLELAADDPELIAGVPFRTLNVWPDAPGFKATLLA
ncbi:MAG: 2-oxoglutarate and iron-dependent oxygenase domain-containing protein [Roseiarcus sp.]